MPEIEVIITVSMGVNNMTTTRRVEVPPSAIATVLPAMAERAARMMAGQYAAIGSGADAAEQGID